MLLYVTALFLVVCSGVMAHEILNGPRMDQPLNPTLLRTIHVLVPFVWIAWLVRGFWIAWWLPLVGLVVGGLVAGIVVAYLRMRFPLTAPGIAIVITLMAIGALVASLTS